MARAAPNGAGERGTQRSWVSSEKAQDPRPGFSTPGAVMQEEGSGPNRSLAGSPRPRASRGAQARAEGLEVPPPPAQGAARIPEGPGCDLPPPRCPRLRTGDPTATAQRQRGDFRRGNGALGAWGVRRNPEGPMSGAAVCSCPGPSAWCSRWPGTAGGSQTAHGCAERRLRGFRPEGTAVSAQRVPAGQRP